MEAIYRYRNYIALDDKQLWADFRSGDLDAFGAIYHHYYRLLYNYGYTIFSRKETIQDCLHELFVELWESRERLSEVNHIKSYLLVSFRRKIIQLLKKKQRFAMAELTEASAIPHPSSEDEFIEKEQHFIFSGRFRKAFEKLPPRRREAVYLRYYQELSYSQIMVVMELQYQTVRDLISKGIKTLRDCLDVVF